MIETTYSLTQAEYCEAVMRVLRFREPGEFSRRRIQLGYLFLLAILPPAIAIYFWVAAGDVIWISHATLLASIAFEAWMIYLLYSLLTFRALKRQLRRFYKRALAEQTNIHLRIDESGWLDQIPGNSTTFVEWAGFSNWMETDAMFLALRLAPHFHMVPKRVLTSAELNELRDLAGGHLPEGILDC